ncbi:MAG: DEAD/DEAH box helicase [Polyangiaceae bacterium]|nr:DEAD/DEAH box helicase [Polyangiaceae bacterium]
MNAPPAAPTPAGIAALTLEQQQLLALLALTEPLNITGYTDLAGSAGVRESSWRAHTTTTLRPLLASLVERGFILQQGSEFRPVPHVGPLVLRHGAAASWLLAMTPGIRMWAARNRGPRWVRCKLEAMLALFLHPPGAEEILARAAAESPGPTTLLCLETLSRPFDAKHFAALPGPLRRTALAMALPHAAGACVAAPQLYQHLVAEPHCIESDEALLAALAGMAANQGDTAALARLAELLGAVSLAPALRAASAVVTGDFPAAAVHLTPQGKRPRTYPGVLGVLQILVLLRNPDPAMLELARRAANAGVRSSPHLSTCFRHLKILATEQGTADPEQTIVVPLLNDLPLCDGWSALVAALGVLWHASSSQALSFATTALSHSMKEFPIGRGAPWVHLQCLQVLDALRKRMGTATRPASPHGTKPSGPSLEALRVIRPAWEQSLERLAALSNPAAPTGGAPDPTARERVLWRVGLHLSDIEPLLQKRTQSGWTKGRRLAVKHLLEGSDLLTRLPPEDQRVAAHAREHHTYSHGYPDVEHFLAESAFVALIGHPRVELDESGELVEVVAGSVELVAESQGDRLRLTVHPPDLRAPITVRRTGKRLVVYSVEENKVRAVVELLGKGLTIPSEGRARALAVLEQVAHLLPIQSAEQTTARTVPADPAPWFRLLPRSSGLLVTLAVRPLGEGPHYRPGAGARTVVGRVRGETQQAKRDLALEARRAAGAIAACPPLDGTERGDQEWLIEDPVDCLALVSALRALGDQVHVEWPEGVPLRLRPPARRSALRGGLQRVKGDFLVKAALAIDDDLSLDLEGLLALVAEQPGRFVKLETGEYLELEDELRETLDALVAARKERDRKARGVVLAPSALSVLDRLTAGGSGFSLDRDTKAWRERIVQVFERRPPIPRTLQAELRPYQLEGYRWLVRLAELELGACLADDMGVGKTVQIVALMLHRAKLGPALVVAPTSVCDNWQSELARFAPSLEVSSYWGPDRGPELVGLGPRKVLVTSYAILQQDAEALAELRFATAVLDEAQLIKNAETRRAQAAFRLQASARVVATGTPVENHLGDLHSLFRFLMPELLGSWQSFTRRFGIGGTDQAGAAGHRALKRLLAPFVLRRTRAEVLDDLPPLTEIEHVVTLSAAEARLYEAVRRDALARLGSATRDPRARVQVLAEITRLRRLCCHPRLVAPDSKLGSSKLEAFVELMEELIEGRHRVLVFSQFVDVLALAKELCDARRITYQYLDGATPTKQRAAAIDAFQSGEGDAFLISLKAGGFGLNLTGADYVIHLDPWWNPAVEAQASGRAHRIGQTRPVTVYRLVTAGTVESSIVALHREKRELAESLLDEADRAASLGIEELRDLLGG